MYNPKLSVIIPVYNTAQHLKRCLDSVLTQTFSDFEVIIINDGSQDGSEKIVDEYSKADSRVVVIHQENSGTAASRNAGLSRAKGDYISFIDSDDYVSPVFLEKLVALAEKDNAQMVICNYSIEHEDGKREICLPQLDDKLTGPEAPRVCFLTYIAKNPALWNKLFQRELLDRIGIKFQLQSCEDLLFCSEIIPHLHTISITGENLYFYIKHPGSITHKREKLIHPKTILDAFIENISENMYFVKSQEELLSIIGARSFVGLMFSSEVVGQNLVFFLDQIKTLRKWSGFPKFCRDIVFGDLMALFIESDAVSRKFIGLSRVLLAPCLVRMDFLSAVLMLMISKWIVQRRRN